MKQAYDIIVIVGGPAREGAEIINYMSAQMKFGALATMWTR